MSDATGTGYPSGGMGGAYGPGYGMTFTDRLKNSVGRNVTVYVGEESTPVMGMLHAVGSNYVEVHRMNNMNNNVNEAMLIPMHAIMAVSAPI